MKKEDIDRINELARKAKTVGLTPEENEERAVLRRAYIDSVVGDLRQQLDNTYIVEGLGLERLMANVNFSDYESRMYFDKSLRDAGIYERMEALGIRDGDTIPICGMTFEYTS